MQARTAKRLALVFKLFALGCAWAGEVLAAEIKVGQTVTVIAESTDLMHGKRVLEALPQGHSATVQRIHSPWILVRTNGRLGWVRLDDVALADAATKVPRLAGTNERPVTEDRIPTAVTAYRDQLAQRVRELLGRRRNDATELEVLRKEVRRLQTSENLNEKLIIEVEPCVQRLDVMLTVDRRVVLQLTPGSLGPTPVVACGTGSLGKVRPCDGRRPPATT